MQNTTTALLVPPRVELKRLDNLFFQLCDRPCNLKCKNCYIKIKMTDEMKKYNTFKIIYVDMDDEGNINTEKPIDLKVEGNYLVGTLEHLSNYALTGSYVVPSNNSTTNNPQTGDNIYMWFGMLLISVFGLSVGMITATKSKKSKVK